MRNHTTSPAAPLGARISERRRSLGLTTDQLARIIGVSARQIRRYESGANSPPLAQLDRIAGALGVAPAWIAYGVEQ